jgi:hypothetical protein
MTTQETLRSEVIAHVRERLNSNPHHASWNKTERLTYELGYVMGILVSLAERDPSIKRELMSRLTLNPNDKT